MPKVVALFGDPSADKAPRVVRAAKLTKRVVDSVKPHAVRELLLWDTELKGFGLRTLPSGIKTYVLQYRNAGGRTRKLALGRHGVLSAEEARDLARQHLAAVKKGGDPSAERYALRKSYTMAELCERFLTVHAESHNKPSSVKLYRGLINRHVLPELGPMKAAAVVGDDVMHLHHALRSTPYEANRTLAVLSKMFNLAAAWRLRPQHSNPCTHVERYPERKRERFFSAEELGRLGKALAEAETARTEKPAAIAAIKLLAFTGCRRGEVLALRWENVDLEGGVLRLPDAKAGARTVALGAPAIVLLEELPRTGQFVVHSAFSSKRQLSCSALEDAWDRIRTSAKIPDGRLHDLRHTVGTYGGQAGLNAFMIRDLLGHKTLAMTGRYVERDTNPMRVAADQVAGRIAAAMNTAVADREPQGNTADAD